VKLLVDAQLPRRLAQELQARGHDAIHTLDLPRQNATTDSEINGVADRDGRIVVTKDGDFRDSHLLRGTPHRLLRVATGNITNNDLIALVTRHLQSIEAAFEDSDHVELTTSELVVHSRHSE
jgi:predicted nuclease of predicted toxin-antitoxin system